MMKLDFAIVPDKYGPNIDKALTLTPQIITRIVEEGIEITRSEVVVRTPVGWSAALRNGYSTQIERRNTKNPRAALLNPILYHDVRDQGRKAGKQPPIEALIPWVGSKLGVPAGPERRQVAFLVARKIGAKGYEGSNHVREGWLEAKKHLQPLLKEAGLKLVQIVSE